ncbi:MAG: hypothetical protein ABW110_00540 [Steroidobacteraceae bacterium]
MALGDDPLETLIDAALRRTAPHSIASLAGQLAQRGGKRTAAVLFYGSALRTNTVEGVLDFYVLLDDVAAWPAARIATLGNRVLPPNVGYVEAAIAGEVLRAKYAVMSLRQFHARMSPSSLDTTLWARFCQPSICIWARSEADRRAVAAAVGDAVITASKWAAWLGPETGTATDYWRTLFAHTYGAELRVESAQRGDDIVTRDATRYTALLPAAWRDAGIEYETPSEGRLTPRLDGAERQHARRRWRRRQRLGKPLNLARLLKATFTFEGATDYIAWKVERHSGVRVEVKPWQRRFPLLAAPGLYWRLRKRGVLR